MRKNLVALYGVQFGQLILPLLTIPFLANVLKPTALGELVAVQSLFLTLGAILEYGFNLSATRRVAIARNDKKKLGSIFSGVIGAKLFLFAPYFLLSFLIFSFVPVFRSQSGLYWAGFLATSLQGFNLFWFYQGIEKLSFAAGVEVILKTFYTLAILLFINDSGDAILVLVFQGISAALSLVILVRKLWSLIEKPRLRMPETMLSLKEGRSMFLFRALTLFYTSGNSALLRLFAIPSIVSYYSTADRLTAATYSLINPITQIFFPRMSYLVHHDFESAKSLFRRSLIIILSLAILAVAIAYYSAPFAIPLIFGKEFAPSVEIFRILIFNTPLIAMSTLFGMQWMIPNGMEKQFNLFICLGAIINIISVIVVVPTHKAIGMAWTILFCEAVIMTFIVIYTLRSSASPFAMSSVDAVEFNQLDKG